MEFNYKSSDQLIFISDNILEDSKYYITLFNNKDIATFSNEEKFNLFGTLDILRNRFFNGREYKKNNGNRKFNRSQENRLVVNYSEIYKFYLFLKSEINMVEFYELDDIYNGIYKTVITEIPSELNEQLYLSEQKVNKELILNENINLEIKLQNSNENLLDKKKSFKFANEKIFELALIFAKEQYGYYHYCNLEKFKGKGGKTYNASQLSKLFFNDSKRDNGIIAYTTNNDLSYYIDDTLNDDNKNKHIFYQLKFNIDFRNEFFKYLKDNRIKCHSFFKKEMIKYNINIETD